MQEKELSLLYSKEEIDQVVREMAERISRDYDGQEVIFICVLKGAFVFMADLVRNLTIPVKIDFVRLSSYGSGSKSSGKIDIIMDTEFSMTGKNVVVVEDILDSGLTLSFLIDRIRSKEPRSLSVCVFIDKRERRSIDIEPDYVGITLEKGFIVGYGLDFDEKYRNLQGIYEVQFVS